MVFFMSSYMILYVRVSYVIGICMIVNEYDME